MNTQNQFPCGLFSAGKKPFTVSNTEEYTHCSTVSLSDNTSWVFRLRDASYIKKIAIFLVASELTDQDGGKKRWTSNLMKCNKCSIACTRKVQLLLRLQSQHIEHQKKNKWSIKKKPQNVLSIFCWWTNRRVKATTWQLSLHRKIQIPGMI